MKLEEVWEQYRSALKAFLHSRVSNHADVDDLLQDILLKTHKGMKNLKDDDRVKSWLFQIAHRTVIDFYRKRGRTDENEKEMEERESIAWYEREAGDAIDDLSHCIDPFIRALPGEFSQLLIAIDIEGRSQKEYAKESGISYSTLKSRVQKGRLELKKIFNQCCRYELDAQGHLLAFEPKTNQCKNC